jgi:phosphoribosylglycinamide formyltransferase-1
VEWVCLAGFMRLISEAFLAAYPSRVLNIHPALLPAFPGLHAQRQTLEYGARVAGCTVHLVDSGTDTGPIIAQGVVPVIDGDDEEALKTRLLKMEHRLFPLALRWACEGRLHVQGRTVRVIPAPQEGTLLFDPTP